jgi:hypothetical protein
MSDGSVYLSPGGGVLEFGQCFDDLTARDRIFSWLAYWQKVVEDNGANFRATLNIRSPEELSIKLTFDNDDGWRAPILYSLALEPEPFSHNLATASERAPKIAARKLLKSH